MDLIEFYIGFLRDRVKDYAEFLRSSADFLNPRPIPMQNPFNPPFTGGQSTGVMYQIQYKSFSPSRGTEYWIGRFNSGATPSPNPYSDAQMRSAGYFGYQAAGKITSSFLWKNFATQIAYGIIANGVTTNDFANFPFAVNTQISVYRIIRADGQPDTGGNLPNPNPAPPIKDDGLWESKNDPISEQAIVLAPALPLVLVASIIAGYLNAINAAKAALDVLDAIKKIAEALESLKDLWEKLREFLNEWDKNRKQKKEIVRQTYGGIQGDGTISFYKEGNTKYTAIQLDIVLTSIPNNIGKYFGEYSPNRYPYGGLGYIAFYSINQGILSTHQIEFKRTSYEIPKLAVGFAYHLGLNEQVRGFAFAEFTKLL